MHLDFNPDNLERYFKNQLSDTERQAMEQMIAQDPLLKSEMHFQQEVVEAICQRRKWELKERLSALAPESTPLFTVPRLAFSGTLALAGMLTATLFWFDSKKIAQAPAVENKPIVDYVQKKKTPIISKKEQAVKKEAIEQKTTYTVPVVRTEVVAPKPTTAVTIEPCLPTDHEMMAQAETGEMAIQEAAIKAYDESLFFEVSNTDTDNGAFDRYSEDERTLERAAINQMLRYQYYNGQLSLYNNTSAGKQMHALMEGELRHFLCYENIYYEFYDGQFSETLMQPLRDKNVLRLVKEMFQQTASIK